jgi:hypothetical protein
MAPLKTNLDDSFQIIIQTTHVIYLARNPWSILLLFLTENAVVHFLLLES